MTNLTDKAIDIKGKKYVLVSDRILAFNQDYPNGSIQTTLVSDVAQEQIVIKAIITPDVKNPTRVFTGYSQATKGDGYINKTSALENAETSAVGRGLAMMGIGVIDSVASVDEIRKAGIEEKKEVKSFPDDEGPMAHVEKLVTQATTITQGLGVCEKCGSPNIKYKTGRIGCSKFCWKN